MFNWYVGALSLGPSYKKSYSLKDTSGASFCHQVAEWFLGMFCNFYSAKEHKIGNKSTTAEAKEKINAHFESLKCYFIIVFLTKF
jgi:hypothetical protein